MAKGKEEEGQSGILALFRKLKSTFGTAKWAFDALVIVIDGVSGTLEKLSKLAIPGDPEEETP